MKKLSIFSAFAVFALAVCGCSKDAAEEHAAPQGMRVSFRGEYAPATDATQQSRVAIDPVTGKTSWIAGDQCNVWVRGNSVTNVPFTNTAEQPDVFSGTLDAGITGTKRVWAIYPYMTDTSIYDDITGGRMYTYIPTEQTQKGDQLGAYSLMTAEGTFADGRISPLRFIHQTAGFCFNVYGSLRSASVNPETLQSVTVTLQDNYFFYPGMVIADPSTTDTSSDGNHATTNREKEMTVKLTDATSTIGYAKADGTKAMLSVFIPEAGYYPIASITVTTDQAVYTKTFDTPKQVAVAAGNVYPINLNLGTFTAAKRFNLGVPGAHNGWSTSDGITGRTAGFFSGMVSFAGDYKYHDNDWWGNGGEPATLYYTLSRNGGNFNITGNYYVVANIASINASLIESISLPGDKNGWSPADAAEFVYDPARDLWIASGVTFNAEEQFKIAFNKRWVDNMSRSIAGGGTVEPGVPVHVVFDSDSNITVGQQGTYDLILDLSTYGGTLVLEPAAVQ